LPADRDRIDDAVNPVDKMAMSLSRFRLRHGGFRNHRWRPLRGLRAGTRAIPSAATFDRARRGSVRLGRTTVKTDVVDSTAHRIQMEPMTGIEPAYSAWEVFSTPERVSDKRRSEA